MKDIGIAVKSEHVEPVPKEELLKMFDQEIEDFSKFMAHLPDVKGQGPLTTPEKMIMKTYLVHKYKGAF